jgi:glycosyltransferase involved in cell wall biosynthesis
VNILQVAHNHPALHPGGTEIFAHALHGAINASGRGRSFFLAGVDGTHRARRPGTAFQAASDLPDEMLLWTSRFDRFFLTQGDPVATFSEFEELLRQLQPDVVHFHHVLLVGIDAIPVVRRVLPRAAIVLTLHDYYLLCHNDGTMVTPGSPPGATGSAEAASRLCDAATPQRCHGCFPEVPARLFKMRELGLRAHLAAVDHFIAPSRFLRDRFVAWGLDADRITVLRNGQALLPIAEGGQVAAPAAPATLSASTRRNRFGLFGNLTPHKGILLALEAARQLAASDIADFSLALFGSDALQGEAFRQQLASARAAAPPQVRFHGPYGAADRPSLYARVDWVLVPSTWWENAPLVIEEAFHFGRPVICSDIGGMAERVGDGENGLHFAAGDPQALAACMTRALGDADLWSSLTARLPAVGSIETCADAHLALFQEILATRAAPTRPVRRRHGPIPALL